MEIKHSNNSIVYALHKNGEFEKASTSFFELRNEAINYLLSTGNKQIWFEIGEAMINNVYPSINHKKPYTAIKIINDCVTKCNFIYEQTLGYEKR